MTIKDDLKLFKTLVRSGWDSLSQQRDSLLSNLGVPALVSVLCYLPEIFDTGGGTALLAYIISGLCYVWMAVATHRTILKGSSAIEGRFPTSWSKRETKFCLYTLGLALVLGMALSVVAIPVSLMGDRTPNMATGLGILLAVTFLYLYSRFSLMFPAIAIDYDVTFRDSWNITSQYQLVMMLIVGVFPVLIAYPALLTGVAMIEAIVHPFTLVIEIAVLSAAFRYIVTDVVQKEDSEDSSNEGPTDIN